MQAAQERPLAEGTGVLVIVTLYGGNDGINTVIPYADNAYHDLRPQLAYAPGDVLHLDDKLGLNPSLKGLEQVWKTGSWPSCAAWAIRGPTTATSARWTSGRPHRRPSPSRRAGSVGGWTPPATTRCVQSTSARCCRRWRLAKNPRPRLFRRRKSRNRRTDSPRRWMRWASATPATPQRWRPCARPTERPGRPMRRSAPSRRRVRSRSHWPVNWAGGRGGQGRGAHPGVLGATGRIRHPRGGAGNPAASAAEARPGRERRFSRRWPATSTAKTLF